MSRYILTAITFAMLSATSAIASHNCSGIDEFGVPCVCSATQAELVIHFANVPDERRLAWIQLCKDKKRELKAYSSAHAADEDDGWQYSAYMQKHLHQIMTLQLYIEKSSK